MLERNPDGTVKAGALNPEGSNGRTPITDSLRVLLTREDDDELTDTPRNNAQRIALEWAKKAKAGELAAITSLTERVEGKANQPIVHSGKLTLEALVGESMADVPSE